MLDEDQNKAIKCINNHSIIVAGAGCGKTTTLVCKIDYLLENNIKPEEILVISFTNETVNNFKNKCKHKIDVFTFHKCALNFLDSKFEICDDDLLDIIIENYFEHIDELVKKKIYKSFNHFYNRYTKENYEKYIGDSTYKSIKKIVKSIICILKSNNININKLCTSNYTRKEILYLFLASQIMNVYTKELKENNMIDFDDIIVIATNKINLNLISHNYKYILVDEYQDISQIRLNFLKALVKCNNSILTVVGDDWQSIYGFSGSNINLFYNFKSEFENVSEFHIRNTYRCPQKIINISTKFILKNKLQIKKNLISKNNSKIFKYKKIYYKNTSTLYCLLQKLDIKNNTVLIISRNNYDINKYLTDKLKYINNEFIINNCIYTNIKFMSIHKSKGLEADIVIILNLSMSTDGLPNSKEINIYGKLKNYKEPIKYAEERRLFYVAMTRCKKELYIIVDSNNPSIFINEV